MNLKVTFRENDSSFKTSFSDTTFIRGDDGKDGATFTPSVSDDGVITWENDGGLQNPPPVNIKGGKGDKGDKGDTGATGKDGYNPVKGVDYFDGKNGVDGKDGIDGKDGVNGKDGVDGHTPVKGKDYYTEAEKEEMVAAVIAALPVYDGEVVTE